MQFILKNSEHIAFDPQTSGGLLISVPAEYATMLILELEKGGDIFSKIVGEVIEPSEEYKSGSVIFNYL